MPQVSPLITYRTHVRTPPQYLPTHTPIRVHTYATSNHPYTARSFPLLPTKASSDDSDDALLEPIGPDETEQLLHVPAEQQDALNRTLDAAPELPADRETEYSATAIQCVPPFEEPAYNAPPGDEFGARGVQVATPDHLAAIPLWTAAAAAYRSVAEGDHIPTLPTNQHLHLQRAADGTLEARIFVLHGDAIQEAGPAMHPGEPPPFIAVSPDIHASDTIELFTLNEGQAAVFLYLVHQLDLDVAAERDDGNTPTPPPSRFIVQGEQGSGKTRLIRAVQWHAFQRQWARWLTVTAYTWRAAGHIASPCQIPISSCSLFGVTPGNQTRSNNTARVSH